MCGCDVLVKLKSAISTYIVQFRRRKRIRIIQHIHATSILAPRIPDRRDTRTRPRQRPHATFYGQPVPPLKVWVEVIQLLAVSFASTPNSSSTSTSTSTSTPSPHLQNVLPHEMEPIVLDRAFRVPFLQPRYIPFFERPNVRQKIRLTNY